MEFQKNKIVKLCCKVLVKLLLSRQFDSKLLRKIYRSMYNMDIGLYSYGCFDKNRFPVEIVIGRYCSFAPTSYVFARNHGVTYLSTHPYLYNADLGLISEDTIKNVVCEISDDVWVGHNAIILPSVSNIGRGAVIAAGSVVTKNIPPYAVVAGNPAKIIKFRFEENIVQRIEESNWWLLSKDDLKKKLIQHKDMFYDPRSFYE